MAVIATQSNYSMGQHRGVYSSSSSFDTYRTNIDVQKDTFFAIKNRLWVLSHSLLYFRSIMYKSY